MIEWPIEFKVPIYGSPDMGGRLKSQLIGWSCMELREDGTIYHRNTHKGEWSVGSSRGFTVVQYRDHPGLAECAKSAYTKAISELILGDDC